jgi:hypothetical protein
MKTNPKEVILEVSNDEESVAVKKPTVNHDEDLEEGEVSESDDEVSIVMVVPNTEKMNSRYIYV